MKWNYATDKEAEMPPDLFDLQIAIGLQSCETKKDVMDLLKDVRQHERLQIKNKNSPEEIVNYPYLSEGVFSAR